MQGQMRDKLRRVQQQMNQGGGRGRRPISAFLVSIGASAILYGLYESLFTVPGGQRAVMFNRLTGLKDTVYNEGTHFRIPYFEWATLFDIRTKPKLIRSPTGTKDLQTVDISLRILYKPSIEALPKIYQQLGDNYDERVLPSIANETLKSVVAQFNASQLITQREQVSALIRKHLEARALQFNIIIDDISITHLSFGSEYTNAVEAKQIAQQEAERAKFLVKQAIQDKRANIIRAEGEAKSAEMIGNAMKANPGYIDLRRLDAAKEISKVISSGSNKVYLDSESLLLNITSGNAGIQQRMQRGIHGEQY